MQTFKTSALILSLGTALLFATGCATDSKMANAKPYPLKGCAVTDEAFHGKPYAFVYEGQLVKLCCDGCLSDFQKEPAKYMKKIADAQK